MARNSTRSVVRCSIQLVDETDGNYAFGHLSLREALALATTLPGNVRITFDQSLAGQTIRLPIAGTLHQPKIDAREVQRLAGRVVEDTAKGMLHKEIGRQLDKLFGPASGRP